MAKWLDNYKDKERRKERNKKDCKIYYEKNKEKMIQDMVKLQKKRRRNVKLKLVKKLGDKCQICGYDECKKILQFHHTIPKKDKRRDVGTMISQNKPYLKLKKEIKGCQLLCPNCHMRLHFDKDFIRHNW